MSSSRLESIPWALWSVLSVAQAALCHKLTAPSQVSWLFHLSASPQTEDSCHFAYLMSAPKVPVLQSCHINSHIYSSLPFVQMRKWRREQPGKAMKGNQRRKWDSNHAPCTRPHVPRRPEASTLDNRQFECQLLGKQGLRRMVEATAWMSLISFCSPAHPPVRSEQKERLKDGKGAPLF